MSDQVLSVFQRKDRLYRKSQRILRVAIFIAVVAGVMVITQLFTSDTAIESFPTILIALASIATSFYAGRVRRRADQIHS